MKLWINYATCVAAICVSAAAHAEVTVKDAWVRATVPQQQATGAFMQLQSSTDTKLVAVSTPLTPNAEVHEMTMQDNVMRMRQIPAIALPAGKTVELTPGTYHLMLMNLKKPVTAGESVPLTLTFEDKAGKRNTVNVQAAVRALNSTPTMDHGAHKH